MADDAAEDNTNGMTAGETTFLVTCLQNVTSGSIEVDFKAVAEILGYSNHRSASNKLGTLKKKYNLPIGGGKAQPAKVPPESPVVLKTPTKTPTSGRVIKSRPSTAKSRGKKSEGESGVDETPAKKPRVRKTPVKKTGEDKTAAQEDASSSSEQEQPKDEPMADVKEELAVESADEVPDDDEESREI